MRVVDPSYLRYFLKCSGWALSSRLLRYCLLLTSLSWCSSFSCRCGTLLQQSPNTYLWLVPEPLTAGFSCCSFSLASCEVLANLSLSLATSLSIASTQSCATSSITWLMMESSVNLVRRSLLSFLPSLSRLRRSPVWCQMHPHVHEMAGSNLGILRWVL